MDLERLASLADQSANSGILVKPVRVHLSLSPQSLGDESQGVTSELDSRLFRYHRDFDGMLLAYTDVRILGGDSYHIDEWGNTHLSVRIQAYIFRPVKGVVVVGTVTDKNSTHIGCLLFDEIRVSVSSQSEADDRVTVGSEIRLQLSHVAHNQIVTKLRGTFISLAHQETESGSTAKKTKKRKRASETVSVADQSTTTLPVTATPDSPVTDSLGRKSAKKKRKHKEREEDEVVVKIKQEEDEVSSLVDNIENRSVNFDSSNRTDFDSLAQSTLVVSTKKKKVKKEKT